MRLKPGYVIAIPLKNRQFAVAYLACYREHVLYVIVHQCPTDSLPKASHVQSIRPSDVKLTAFVLDPGVRLQEWALVDFVSLDQMPAFVSEAPVFGALDREEERGWRDVYDLATLDRVKSEECSTREAHRLDPSCIYGHAALVDLLDWLLVDKHDVSDRPRYARYLRQELP